MNQLVLLLAGGLLVALGFYIGLRRSRTAQSIDEVPAPSTDPAPKKPETSVVLAIEPRLEPPSLMDPLTEKTVLTGGAATFTVAAEGTGLSYQWFRNGVAIPGATNPTLQIENLTGAEDGHLLSVEISNDGGRIQSGPAMLRVVTKPRITRQPKDIRLKQGEKAMLEAQAEGTGPLSYQWFRDDQPISGATEPFLEAQAIPGSLHLRVENPWGEACTRMSQVTVLVPPSLLAEPESVSVLAGEEITLAVEAVSAIPLSYQWHRNGVPIPGETEPKLFLPSATEEDNGAEYQVSICNSVGMLRSRPAKVEVRLNRLIVGDPARPELALSRWDGVPVKSRDILMTPTLKSRMSMLVQPGVNLAQQGYTAANAFKVVFSPEVTQGLREGTYHLMAGAQGNFTSATSKATGKIVGNGQLVANNAVRAMAAATAVWQVMAVVTAQKFLADIDKKLSAIDKGVKEIQAWLEGDAVETLHAGHEYLQGVSQVIHEQRLSQPEVTSFLTQIEQIDRETNKVARQFLKKMERIESEFPTITSSWFGGRSVKESVALDSKLSDWSHCIQVFLGAQRVRGAAAQVRCALPVQQGPTLHRIESIESVLGDFEATNKEMMANLRKQSSNLWSAFTVDKASEAQKKIKGSIDSLETQFRAVSEDLRGTTATLRSGLMDLSVMEQRETALLLTLDADGEVARLEQIEEQSA